MRLLVTGAAGFIGFHLTRRLLRDGHTVTALDNVTPYYSVTLKRDRLAALAAEADPTRFSFSETDTCDHASLRTLFQQSRPDCVIHLAAQPGVRYSLTEPFAYQKSNLEGFLSVLECCRHTEGLPRLIYASSSSVYGGNTHMPFSEDQAVDHPFSLYGATKRANELMAHAYSHLYGMQTIGLRFFTVYGPWYRPDMALYLFADAMTQGRPIKLFNNGDMWRDFTYVDDIVEGVTRCISHDTFDRYEILNIGNHRSEKLTDVIDILSAELGVHPELEYLPMQDGDVPATWADISRLQAKTGYAPVTPIRVGIPRFTDWYKAYVMNKHT